jgi:hypothetical protein
LAVVAKPQISFDGWFLWWCVTFFSSNWQAMLACLGLIELLKGPILIQVVCITVAHQKFAPVPAHFQTFAGYHVEKLVLLKRNVQ